MPRLLYRIKRAVIEDPYLIIGPLQLLWVVLMFWWILTSVG